MVTDQRVTISDCGKALDSIEREIQKLEKEASNIKRKIEALRTQGLMIRELVRHL